MCQANFTRLVRGRSTPAILAMTLSLALALLVLLVRADHANHAAPADDLAFIANALD
jgi:hypothetical protein